jgi:hypothetical protein
VGHFLPGTEPVPDKNISSLAPQAFKDGHANFVG